jgi:predicted acyl esterase
MGPWRHSGFNYNGSSLGAAQVRGRHRAPGAARHPAPVLQRLSEGRRTRLHAAAKASFYNTGENRWDYLDKWPLACETGCDAKLTPIYLKPAEGSASTSRGRDRTAMSPILPSRCRICRGR